MNPSSLFGLSDHLAALSKHGDPLEVLDGVVDFEHFRGWLVAGLGYGDGAKGGRPPFDPVAMFKALILQAQHNLSDARMEFIIRDRLSSLRLLGLDLRLRQSITFDNEAAFARHTLLREALDMAAWFCDACASGQKGGIENANGRLRRWLPRQINIGNLSDEDLQEIITTYNLTPRICLGYLTPIQTLLHELGRDVRLRFA